MRPQNDPFGTLAPRADVIWLATQGSWVTGMDVSRVVLERVTAAAERLGVADRVNVVRADRLSWQPGAETHDLVTAPVIPLTCVA